MGQVMDWIKKWQNPDGKPPAKQGLVMAGKPVQPIEDATQVQKENDPNAKMTAQEQLAILDRKKSK